MVVESPHQRLVPFWHDDDGKTLMRRRVDRRARVQRVPRLPGGQGTMNKGTRGQETGDSGVQKGPGRAFHIRKYITP